MGQHVTGVDVSTGMLEQAREKASKSGLEITFAEADAEDTGFDDSCFDLVISRHVLWNLLNPAQALSEWMRVVRPGGTVAVIDGLWNPDKMRTRLKDAWGEAYQEVFEKLPLYGGAPAE
ncbi:MAG: class I SAM-dependent methyltransferase, partial [Candidatus Binatia bacterium]